MQQLEKKVQTSSKCHDAIACWASNVCVCAQEADRLKQGWGRAGRPAIAMACVIQVVCAVKAIHSCGSLIPQVGAAKTQQPTQGCKIHPSTHAFTARTQDLSWDALEDQVCLAIDVVAAAAGVVGAWTELAVRAAAPSAAVPATAVTSGAEKLSCEYAWKGDGRGLPTLQL